MVKGRDARDYVWVRILTVLCALLYLPCHYLIMSLSPVVYLFAVANMVSRLSHLWFRYIIPPMKLSKTINLPGYFMSQQQWPIAVRTIKVKSALKLLCPSCRFVKRKGRLRVVCTNKPRHKQRQG